MKHLNFPFIFTHHWTWRYGRPLSCKPNCKRNISCIIRLRTDKQLLSKQLGDIHMIMLFPESFRWKNWSAESCLLTSAVPNWNNSLLVKMKLKCCYFPQQNKTTRSLRKHQMYWGNVIHTGQTCDNPYVNWL